MSVMSSLRSWTFSIGSWSLGTGRGLKPKFFGTGGSSARAKAESSQEPRRCRRRRTMSSPAFRCSTWGERLQGPIAHLGSLSRLWRTSCRSSTSSSRWDVCAAYRA